MFCLSLLGHSCVLHDFVSLADPTHSSPLCIASVLFLERNCRPPSQVTVHTDQSDHSAHLQSTNA